MSQLPITTLVGGAGFVAGMAFGAIANKTNFCTIGAISDIVFMQDWRRMRAWLLAIAVAMLATQAMNAAGVIDTGKSIYLTPNFGVARRDPRRPAVRLRHGLAGVAPTRRWCASAAAISNPLLFCWSSAYSLT